jgi:chorismate mutase
MHALRAAITLDSDSQDEVRSRTTKLLETLYERNALTHDSVISILFTATNDITSAPPAAAAREFGLLDVPLLCAAEMPVKGSLQLCIRLMLHIESDMPRSDLRHVFLRGATVLRPELAEPGDDSL